MMKTMSLFATAAMIAAFASPAFAQEATAGSEANAGAAAGAQAGAVSGSGGNSVSSSVTFEGSHIPRDELQAPNVVPPGQFVPGINSCAGLGTSVGISVPGAGIAGGGNRMDEGCATVRRVEALRRSTWNLPRIAGEVALCQGDLSIQAAYATMGITCNDLPRLLLTQQAPTPSAMHQSPEPQAAHQASAEVAVSEGAEEGEDPIVRRLNQGEAQYQQLALRARFLEVAAEPIREMEGPIQ